MTPNDLRKLLPIGENIRGVRVTDEDGRGATLFLYPPKEGESSGEIMLLWHDTGKEVVLYKVLSKILSKVHPSPEGILDTLQLRAPAPTQLNQGWDDDPLST